VCAASVPSSVERECKLNAAPGFVLPAELFRSEGVELVPAADLELDAVYHDTADLRLAREGVTLRHRRGEGPPRWTLKLPAGRTGLDGAAGLRRRELDVEDPDGDPFGAPPASLVELVTAYRRTAPLVPVARVHTVRRRRRLVDSAGRDLGELDDDEVSVLPVPGATGAAPAGGFREVEIELAPGTPDHLLGRLVDRLRTVGAMPAEQVPKVVRALGPAAAAPPDVPADRPGPQATAVERCRAALAEGTRALIDADPGLRLGDDPGATERARDAVARLLGALEAFAEILPAAWRREVGAGLGSLAVALDRAGAGAGSPADALSSREYPGLLDALVVGPWPDRAVR